MLDRDVELPIRDLMSKLVLSMPIDSTQLGVQFNKAITAQSLIIFSLGDIEAIGLKEFVGKFIRDD